MIYADNAATTRMSAAAIDAMRSCMEENWGNPSSLYRLGQSASETLQNARERIAACIGAASGEVVFTSGGSEADNQAILSAARLGVQKGKKHIISTAFEHDAVLHTLEALQADGFEVTLLPVHSDGLVVPEEVTAAIRLDTCLVTVMYANNEIGTVQPISKIGRICREVGVPFHTDAVQAVGHLPIHVKEQSIDMLSFSAHKFHGPKGVGALYVRNGISIQPLIHGGEQERGRRAGTENIPAIMGMAAALEESCDGVEKNSAHLTRLRDRLVNGLSHIPHSTSNGSMLHRLPGNVNFSFAGIEGESLVLLLDKLGICASTGSACNSSSMEPSHVLLAIGQPPELAYGSLRLTLCAENTQAEIDYLIHAVSEAVLKLRRKSFGECSIHL